MWHVYVIDNLVWCVRELSWVLNQLDTIEAPTQDDVLRIRNGLGNVITIANNILSFLHAWGLEREARWFYPLINALEIVYIATERLDAVVFDPSFRSMIQIIINIMEEYVHYLTEWMYYAPDYDYNLIRLIVRVSLRTMVFICIACLTRNGIPGPPECG